jgi:copper resistance protein C
MRYVMTAVALAVCAAFTASAVSAHTTLVTSIPKEGETLKTSPSEIRLTFSERIEPLLSAMEVVGAKGEGLDIGNPVVRGAEMAIPLEGSLDAGIYKVNWHLVSMDGHRVEGAFAFEVAR